MEFEFWLQSHNVIIEKIEIKNWFCGAKPKLAKFDQRRPFKDELVKLTCKPIKRHINGLQFLIAVT